MRALLFVLLFSSAAPAQSTHALIVTGLAGEPKLAESYAQDGAALRDAITRMGGTATLLSESSTPRSDRTGLQQAFARLTQSSERGDRILIVLIGHGGTDGLEARFNIPGPDVTASDLAHLLEPLAGREVAVVVATSSSGAFVSSISAPGRVIVTATRSATENEEVTFPHYFARAFSSDGADTDKDGGISIAEAFEYARREVARFYEQSKRMATEHALLDDNGDGKGSLTLDANDGARARLFVLRAASPVVMSDSVRVLLAQRADLERQVADLKAHKSTMAADAYDAALEKLLLQLARIGQAVRASEGKQ